MEEPTDDELTELFQPYVDDGSANGIVRNEDGELVIEWNMRKLEILHPETYNMVIDSMMDEIGEALDSLVGQGLLHMDVQETPDGDLEPVYELSEKGKDFVENMGLDSND